MELQTLMENVQIIQHIMIMNMLNIVKILLLKYC